MGERTRSLSFAITGEFVTRTAREWLWLEAKPWSTVEEFLLSCMHGTDQTREELVDLAIKVVTGKAKFIGNTADDTYALVEDNQDLIGDYIGRWSRKLKQLEKDHRELENKWSQLTAYLMDSGRGYMLKDAGVDESDEGDRGLGYGLSVMLDSYLKEERIEREGHKDNYGWLDPQGNFYPVEFADHQNWAYHKVRQLGIVEKYAADYGDSGDLLVERGWALLHNPGMGVAYVTANPTKPLTKAQKDFLYGYYLDRGLTKNAELYVAD